MMAARAGKPEGREQEQHGHEMADYGRGGILRGRVGFRGCAVRSFQGVFTAFRNVEGVRRIYTSLWKGAVPGPEGTEPVRLEQAIDATRAAKDARALKEAAALDAYWQSRLDALYAPVAAWLASRWFVKSELIEHQSKWFKEMPLQELQDEIVMESWVQAQVAWEAFLRADERFYRAWMLADQNRRSAMKGEGVPDAGSLGELEEAEVHVRRAFKKMERMMAIADTACATNAYPLVDIAPVDPGWQENDPVLQKVEQAVCSSEYPFVKFLLGSYRNYWKARLSGIRTAFLP